MGLHRAILAVSSLLILAAACAPVPTETQSAKSGGRYTDPYTCEVKNKGPNDPPYDPDCIKAAQAAAAIASKSAKKK